MDKLSRLALQETEQYFHGEHLESFGNQFVAWVDIMGMRDALTNREKMPAILRGELLSTVYQYIDRDKVDIISIGDGVVLLTDYEEYLHDFLTELFHFYTRFNVKRYQEDHWESIHFHRFIRAGVGSGVSYVIDLDFYDEDNNDGSPFPEEFSNRPFGPGPIQALNAEGGSPLGIQESDWRGQGQPIKWWTEGVLPDSKRKSLLELLDEYFRWYDKKKIYSYEPYKRDHHIQAMKYFNADDFGIDLSPE